MSDYGVGSSGNNRDISLGFLGNYCNLRNPEAAAPERGKCQPLLGMGNGATSAGDPLACLWTQLNTSALMSLSTPSFVPLSLSACLLFHLAYICCVTFGKCCPSLGLKSPLFSFEVYNWVPSAVFSTLQSCFCADQFQLQVSPFSASREKCQAASGENTKTTNRNNALI